MTVFGLFFFDMINYTAESKIILDVFLVYVIMTCDTQSCIKSIVDGDIMYKLPKDWTVRAA